MRRSLFPTRSRHRRQALARGAGAAGVAVLMACLFGCKGGGDAADAARPVAASSVATAPADVPPPPVLRGVAATPAPGATASTASGDLATVRAQLDKTLVNASSCSADAECRTVATGAKACGGPTAYRAFSAKGADPQAVADLAQHERDLTMIQVRESGRVSACFMLADPGAHCQKNKCVTGPAATN